MAHSCAKCFPGCSHWPDSHHSSGYAVRCPHLTDVRTCQESHKTVGLPLPVKISGTERPWALNHRTTKHLSKNKIAYEPTLEKIKFSDHPWVNSRWVKYLNIKCKTMWKDRMQKKYFYIIRGREALLKYGMQPIGYKRKWWPLGKI